MPFIEIDYIGFGKLFPIPIPIPNLLPHHTTPWGNFVYKLGTILSSNAKMLMNDDFGDIIVKGGNLPKEQINVINRTPILTKREKPRLILKWAEPEYEIIDLPKLEKQKPRRRK